MKTRLLTIIAVGISFFFLTACNENGDVVEINSALDRVALVQTAVSAFPLDSIGVVRTRLTEAKDDIKWLALDSNVVFVKSDAKAVGDLALASRYLKDTPGRISGLVNEIGRCKTQLTGLKELIELSATLDAKGDTIDDVYLKKNLDIEIEAVNNLESALFETSRLIRLGLETDSASWASIDSLITEKKGLWARGIAGEDNVIRTHEE